MFKSINIKERTSNTATVSYNMGSCPFGLQCSISIIVSLCAYLGGSDWSWGWENRFGYRLYLHHNAHYSDTDNSIAYFSDMDGHNSTMGGVHYEAIGTVHQLISYHV